MVCSKFRAAPRGEGDDRLAGRRRSADEARFPAPPTAIQAARAGLAPAPAGFLGAFRMGDGDGATSSPRVRRDDAQMVRPCRCRPERLFLEFRVSFNHPMGQLRSNSSWWPGRPRSPRFHSPRHGPRPAAATRPRPTVSSIKRDGRRRRSSPWWPRAWRSRRSMAEPTRGRQPWAVPRRLPAGELLPAPSGHRVALRPDSVRAGRNPLPRRPRAFGRAGQNGRTPRRAIDAVRRWRKSGPAATR